LVCGEEVIADEIATGAAVDETHGWMPAQLAGEPDKLARACIGLGKLAYLQLVVLADFG
jgi:hypothetical protein